MTFSNRLRKMPWISAARRLERYPPYRAMGVKVLELSDDWRHARLLLPLNGFNRNPAGGMFGGAIASLADPVAALSCNKVFPGHQVWTRAMTIDFRREGRSDLELRFDFDAAQEQQLALELARKGRATPTFEYGFYNLDGCLCVKVVNTVAIRPANYQPAKTVQVESKSNE